MNFRLSIGVFIVFSPKFNDNYSFDHWLLDCQS